MTDGEGIPRLALLPVILRSMAVMIFAKTGRQQALRRLSALFGIPASVFLSGLLAAGLSLPVAASVMSDRNALIYPDAVYHLQLDYGRSSGVNEDLYGEYVLAVGSGSLRFGLGLSEVDTDTGELFTRTFMVGAEGMVSDRWGLDFSFLSWGDPGDLTSETFSVAAKWYGERLVASATGSLRRINFFTFIDDPRDDRQSGTGNGLQASVSYVGRHGWDWAAEVSLYEYSLDMRQFDQRFADTPLTNRALELGGGFLDNNYLLELGYSIGNLRSALSWENSTSAVDGMSSNTWTWQEQYESRRGQSLALLLGRSLTADGTVFNFGRVSLGYRW